MTPGQRAYEEEIKLYPYYEKGVLRGGWDSLDAIAKKSWERNPTPRTLHKIHRDGTRTILTEYSGAYR